MTPTYSHDSHDIPMDVDYLVKRSHEVIYKEDLPGQCPRGKREREKEGKEWGERGREPI